MPDVVIENPILNAPYAAPTRHWRFGNDGITDEVVEGRRKSAYFMPIPASRRRTGSQQQLEFAEWTEEEGEGARIGAAVIEETRFVTTSATSWTSGASATGRGSPLPPGASWSTGRTPNERPAFSLDPPRNSVN